MTWPQRRECALAALSMRDNGFTLKQIGAATVPAVGAERARQLCAQGRRILARNRENSKS